MRLPAPLRRPSPALALAASALGAAGLFALPRREASAQGQGLAVDMELLRESLLKIWIIEESSSRYNQARIGEKSFDAMLAKSEPTGDPERDKENAAAVKKLDKEVRHYLLLELDGAIECVDIADRVLGTKVTLSGDDAERRRFLTREVPALAWRNVALGDAFKDLERKMGIEIDFPPLPRNLSLEISYEAPAGLALYNVLEFINSEHPIRFEVKNGRLEVRYMGEIPPERGR